MQFKYTLGGRNVIDGDNAEKIFNIVCNRRLPTSNFWVYWNEFEESATIGVTLKTISAKFEITGANDRFLNSVLSIFLEPKQHDYSNDTKEIYSFMLDQIGMQKNDI